MVAEAGVEGGEGGYRSVNNLSRFVCGCNHSANRRLKKKEIKRRLAFAAVISRFLEPSYDLSSVFRVLGRAQVSDVWMTIDRSRYVKERNRVTLHERESLESVRLLKLIGFGF